MTDIFNIVGDRQTIQKMLKELKITPTDDFSQGSSTMDINVEVPCENSDDLIDWCQDNNLEITMV